MSLVDEIKDLRVRTADGFSEIYSLARQARQKILSGKPGTVKVEHGSGNYVFYHRIGTSGDAEYTRPIRSDLYIGDSDELEQAVTDTFKGKWKANQNLLLEKVVYTLTQDVASYLDFFASAAAKKALGTFFEGVVAAVINRVSGEVVRSGTIPIPSMDHKVNVDLGIWSPAGVKLLVATKTSTRERLSQPFVQRLIISRTQVAPSRSILVVIGDVQRVKGNRVQHTFTAGQFRLYSQFVAPLDGVYYIDMPPQAASLVADGLMKRFNQLSNDLGKLLV